MSVQNTHTRAGRHLLKTPIIQRISHSSQNMSFNYPSKVCNSHTVHGAKGVDLCVCVWWQQQDTDRPAHQRTHRPATHITRCTRRPRRRSISCGQTSSLLYGVCAWVRAKRVVISGRRECTTLSRACVRCGACSDDKDEYRRDAL